MTRVGRTQIRSRIENLNVWKRGGVRAPHKPLLLLLAFSRLIGGQPRLSSFAELEEPLRRLLEKYGPPRRTFHPEYPFWRLQGDELWEVFGAENLIRRRSNTDPLKRELIEKNVAGGLPDDIFELLRSDRRFLQELALTLGEGHFPESICNDLLEELGLAAIQLPPGQRREAAFRSAVLQAYGQRCAICGYDARFGHSSLGLEAAHIQWCQAGGPDRVDNGVALCTLHHKAFDRGAVGIDETLKVVVSADIFGHAGPEEWFFRFNGQPIILPHSPSLVPRRRFIQWHCREVFRMPIRAM